LRIAVHDFVGHAFALELTRELAARGHEARHFFFEGYPGPKGDARAGPNDPPGFSIEPLHLRQSYPTGQFVRRGLNNLRYGRLAARRIAAFSPQVVLSGNTPIEAQGALADASHEVGAAFVFWMQDLYSLAVGSLVSRRAPVIGSLLHHVYRVNEAAQLRRSDEIVLISNGFRAELQAFGLDADRITVIPNWGPLAELPVRPKANAWRAEQGLNDRFVFLYAGTLGLKHNPQRLVDLADAFANDPSVAVVAVCAGAGEKTLSSQLSAAPRENLRLLPLEAIERFADVLAAADVTIGLLETDAGRFSVPSKVLSYLCACRPVLLSAPEANLAAQTVLGAGAGLVVDPEDSAAFTVAAQRLRGDAGLRATLGAAGRDYAEQHFAMAGIADRFQAVFARAIERRNVKSG
jgi:colanic acid biosynthesis glycosyl transferase WcaI